MDLKHPAQGRLLELVTFRFLILGPHFWWGQKTLIFPPQGVPWKDSVLVEGGLEEEEEEIMDDWQLKAMPQAANKFEDRDLMVNIHYRAAQECLNWLLCKFLMDCLAMLLNPSLPPCPATWASIPGYLDSLWSFACTPYPETPTGLLSWPPQGNTERSPINRPLLTIPEMPSPYSL